MNARADLKRGEISPEKESAFYYAMADIVAKSPYPNAKVADDLSSSRAPPSWAAGPIAALH
jgi:hypothetical protein